jgi:L,D-peptidoglycan transpeptidase YkuD (ErfK/YbiS/YcfS/YnhG family)
MFLGDEPATVFDYVVAINFNRLPNAPPSDPTEPLGAAVGGGIWLHVSDGEPTESCVSIPRPDIVDVLRWLESGRHPVIVMGNRARLAA